MPLCLLFAIQLDLKRGANVYCVWAANSTFILECAKVTRILVIVPCDMEMVNNLDHNTTAI